MSTPTRYRCTHVIEAMQWRDTPDNRDAFVAWFQQHGELFLTEGSMVIMTTAGNVSEGEWVIWGNGEFAAMDIQTFAEFISDYRETQPAVAP